MKMRGSISIKLTSFLTGDQIHQAVAIYRKYGQVNASTVVDLLQSELIKPNFSEIATKFNWPIDARFLAYCIYDVLLRATSKIDPLYCPHCKQIAVTYDDILPPACPAHGGVPNASE